MGEVTEAYLQSMKEAVRVDIDDFDEEIRQLILSARNELHLAGISESKCKDENDALIQRAVTVFVRAEFGIENPDREKYLNSFESIKLRLAVSQAYTEGD